MGAEVIEATGGGSHQPFYFPSGNPQLFGWLHQPAGVAASDWGVVICKPFGYEAQCAHRSLRAFADAAAGLGMPTLRFDYLGTGDSADIDPSADQVEAWKRDLTNAVLELRRLTGISRVCLLGFRLGALIALLASGECQVDALALVAPVLSGKRYLREARTLQLAADAAEAAKSPGAAAPGGASGAAAGGMEVSGYPLSQATLASLSRIDLAGTPLVAVPQVLVIDRSDLPAARAWTQALSDRHVKAEYHALPGFVEMMSTEPQLAKLPQEMLQATRAWLLRLREQPADRAPTVARPEHRARSAATELILEGAGPGSCFIIERGVFLDQDHVVFGVLTAPGGEENRRRAVILLNIGADSHVGASRIYVSLARRWARRGYHVLRMDLAGLGDSHTRPGRAENDVFPPEAVADIRAAADFMLDRYQAREINLVGLCSGAYHALRAAVAGLPLQRLLMVNAMNYSWEEGMSSEVLRPAEVVRNAGIYRERMLSGHAWRRFLTGQVNIWRIVSVQLHRALFALQSRFRDTARLIGIRLRHDLGRELEAVVGRGIRMVFIFARGEPGLDLLRIEAGSMIGRLGERCRVRIIDNADHAFSRGGPRKVLEDVLSAELFARQDAVSAAGEASEDQLRDPARATMVKIE